MIDEYFSVMDNEHCHTLLLLILCIQIIIYTIPLLVVGFYYLTLGLPMFVDVILY